MALHPFEHEPQQDDVEQAQRPIYGGDVVPQDGWYFNETTRALNWFHVGDTVIGEGESWHWLTADEDADHVTLFGIIRQRGYRGDESGIHLIH